MKIESKLTVERRVGGPLKRLVGNVRENPEYESVTVEQVEEIVKDKTA